MCAGWYPTCTWYGELLQVQLDGTQEELLSLPEQAHQQRFAERLTGVCLTMGITSRQSSLRGKLSPAI